MGYMLHHAIVVTGWNKEQVDSLHDKCMEISGKHLPEGCKGVIFSVTPVSRAAMNGYVGFAVLPDGSKEWWEHSDCGDKARNEIVELLRVNEYCSWVEVQFGDDNGETKIVRDSSHTEVA